MPTLELAVTAAASIADLVLGGGQAVGLLSNGGDAAERYPADWTGGSFRRLEDALEDAGTRRRISAFRPVELAPGGAAGSGSGWGAPWRGWPWLPAFLSPSCSTPSCPGCRVPWSSSSSRRAWGRPGGRALRLRRSGFEAGVVWIQRPGRKRTPPICRRASPSTRCATTPTWRAWELPRYERTRRGRRVRLPGFTLHPFTHHAVVPAAVIAMVASLLFYLVDVRSAFLGGGPSLKWIGFCFAVATVLIERFRYHGSYGATPTSRGATPWPSSAPPSW